MHNQASAALPAATRSTYMPPLDSGDLLGVAHDDFEQEEALDFGRGLVNGLRAVILLAGLAPLTVGVLLAFARDTTGMLIAGITVLALLVLELNLRPAARR